MKTSTKLILILCILGCMFMNLAAKDLEKNAKKGTITAEQLKKIRSQYKQDPDLKAKINAITNNDIAQIALDRQNLNQIDGHFKYRVKTKGITDQKRSGRCWMFTGLNVLRPKIIEKLNLDGFEFSTNYLFFWDQFEKSNLFLEAIIKSRSEPKDARIVEWLLKHPIGDGGVWNLFADTVNKYGLVPKSVMKETRQSENTRVISRLIRRKLRENALLIRSKRRLSDAKLRKLKLQMLSEIYKMLVFSLGEPPESFQWRYKDKKGKISSLETFTPKSFYKQFINIDLNDYVLFMDDPSRPYEKLYEIEYDRNIYEGRNWQFINLPSSRIKSFAKQSIINNEAMYFSCDVGKQLNRKRGILSVSNYDYESLFGIRFGMTKRQRIASFESGSTHGMALVGVDTDTDGKIRKWLLENSWGSKSGHKGHLIMTDRWFDEYMFRLVIHKRFIDPEVLAMLKQKAKKLPPWDPLFAPDM